MTKLILYSGAGASFTPVFTEGRVESGRYRLIADDGMAITDGERVVVCVDTDAPDDWRDCETAEGEE